MTMADLGDTRRDNSPTRPSIYVRRGVTAALLGVTVAGCSDSDPVGPGDEEAPVMVELDLALSAGSIGLVIDVRDIFRRGYIPTEAEVSFQTQPARDAILEIDPLTNVAILVLPNDSLTEAEQTAFGAGVPTNIVIRDEQAELANANFDQLVLDDHNEPVSIENATLPFRQQDFILEEDKPYLLQVEAVHAEDPDFVLINTRFLISDGRGSGGLETARYTDPDTDSVPSLAERQEVFVKRADSADTVAYQIALRAPQLSPSDTTLFICRPFNSTFFFLSGALCFGGPIVFVPEQDPDGWVRLRVRDTGRYLGWRGLAGDPGKLESLDPALVDRHARFRFFSNNVRWTVTDRGTAFSQPIMPPATLDFAFQSQLFNCSSATLTETVGRTQKRSSTTTFATSESLTLLSSVTVSVEMTVGVSTGVNVAGLGAVEVSAEVKRGLELSHSRTSATGRTFSESSSVEVEVSRERILELRPFSAVQVSDFIRTVRNVVTPFTQVLRAKGRYRDNARPLSGEEITTQVMGSFFEGAITQVGDDFVDFSIRGEAHTNAFYEAQTLVTDLPGACSP